MRQIDSSLTAQSWRGENYSIPSSEREKKARYLRCSVIEAEEPRERGRGRDRRRKGREIKARVSSAEAGKPKEEED